MLANTFTKKLCFVIV